MTPSTVFKMRNHFFSTGRSCVGLGLSLDRLGLVEFDASELSTGRKDVPLEDWREVGLADGSVVRWCIGILGPSEILVSAKSDSSRARARSSPGGGSLS